MGIKLTPAIQAAMDRAVQAQMSAPHMQDLGGRPGAAQEVARDAMRDYLRGQKPKTAAPPSVPGLDSLTIAISIPARVLSPNQARNHFWAKISEARKAQREEAFAAAIQALCGKPAPHWPKATLDIAWYAPKRQWPDPMNVGYFLKGAIDGLEDAKIIVNDKELHCGRYERVVDAETPRVQLTVKPIWENQV